MIRITHILFFGILIFSSCDGLKNKEEKAQAMQNQLAVTTNGDTLETGFWTYNGAANGVSKSGTYADGYKVGNWIYKIK